MDALAGDSPFEKTVLEEEKKEVVQYNERCYDVFQRHTIYAASAVGICAVLMCVAVLVYFIFVQLGSLTLKGKFEDFSDDDKAATFAIQPLVGAAEAIAITCFATAISVACFAQKIKNQIQGKCRQV